MHLYWIKLKIAFSLRKGWWIIPVWVGGFTLRGLAVDSLGTVLVEILDMYLLVG